MAEGQRTRTKQVKRTQRIVQAVGSTQLLRTGIADSFEMKTWGSTRGLTPAEVNTEAFALVRMWRAPGVKRLWHVQRDVLKNLRAPSGPQWEIEGEN